MPAVIRRVLFVLALIGGPVVAADKPDKQDRSFDVTVDGKRAGTFNLGWSANGDRHTVSAHADVKFKTLIGTYKYTLTSKEEWEGGKLVSLDATAVNDGKKSAVAAAAKKEGLAVTADGKTRTVSGSAITTTGWFLPNPPAEKGTAKVVVVDTEDGSDTEAKVERLTDKEWGGRMVKRFKLTGKDLDCEWWYDTSDRPVRMAMVWDGHQVVFTQGGDRR